LGAKVIKLINLNTKTECIVTPTIFPDQSSQVWKIDNSVYCSGASRYKIIWHYENEAELIHLLQLKKLIKDDSVSFSSAKYGIEELVIPYFPYARQDKPIDNNSTFSRTVILDLLNQYFSKTKITTFDVHSELAGIVNVHPIWEIVNTIHESKVDLICYPDSGAEKRYAKQFINYVVAEKVRNQTTGVIEGHKLLDEGINLLDKNVLIVDDICDGGATFISVAKMLKSAGAANIDLYVSHGIFSKGVHLLTELGGIRNIYTTDSYLPSQAKLKNHSNVKVFKLEL
jgi:ribose-phosphate pyrophosphokinase